MELAKVRNADQSTGNIVSFDVEPGMGVKIIPVIILTAKIDAESERRCMRSGAVGYIKKPWGPASLGIGSQLRLVTRATDDCPCPLASL